MILSLTLPIKLVSEANQREHWATKSRRVKAQRGAIRLACEASRKQQEALGAMLCEGGLSITVTRIAPRALDAHDNLKGSCKAIVDGIADWLIIRDNDPRVTWLVEQERGAPKTYAVRVEVRERGERVLATAPLERQ